MIEYFSSADDGTTTRFRDHGEIGMALGPNPAHMADVYTSYHPHNARYVLESFQNNRHIAACSDLLVGCVVNSGRPDQLADGMKALRYRCPDHGGFRPLHGLDYLHYAFHAQWQEPGFRFTDEYFRDLNKGGWAQHYPLRKFFDFLGLNRVYSVLTIAAWIDYRRFAVAPDEDAVTDQLFHDYMMVEGPKRETYNAIVEKGVLSVANWCLEHKEPGNRLLRWLVSSGTWKAVDIDSHSVLGRLHARAWKQHRGLPASEAEYRVSCDLTELAVNYLYVHHRWLYSGGSYGFNPWSFFGESRDVANEYNRAFSGG